MWLGISKHGLIADMPWSPTEIQAALDAGMKAAVVDRKGNAPLSDEDRQRYNVVGSLEEINLPT